MTERDADVEAKVRDALGQSGVRMAFAKLTAARAKLLHRGGEFVRFVDSVLRAAIRAQPADPGGPLREVVAGVGDGIATAALAARLAIEEAAKRGERFAQEDLKRIADEFGATMRGFTAGVKKAATGTAAASKDLLVHADTTLARIQPGLQKALDAALQQPGKTLEEAAGEGVRAAQRGAGALFRALGDHLRSAGERLQRSEH